VAEISKDELRKQIRSRSFAPVYVLFGAETYLRDAALKTIVKFAFEENDLRDFNETDVSIVGGELRDLLAAAQQLPMMSSRRVVVIRDVSIASSAASDTLKEADEETLAAYLKDPSPTAIVIFVVDELNGNRKLSKILKAGAVWIDFKTLDHAGMLAQARRFAADESVDIGETELRLLVDTVGDNVRRLHNEVVKLATAALPEKRITSEMIGSLVGNSRLVENFALTGNLLSGNKIGAMRTMKKILDDGGEPLAILGLIGSNLRKIMMAKDMMEKGADTRTIENTIKVRMSDREAFLAAARRTRVSKIHRAINRIAETDLAIKTSLSGGGTHGSRRQIEMLVSELALLN